MTTEAQETERLRRWRLLLGGGEGNGTVMSLSGDDLAIDRALGALYGRGGFARSGDKSGERRGG